MLSRMANREDPDQTASLICVCAVCLGLFGRQQVFKILEHLLYPWSFWLDRFCQQERSNKTQISRCLHTTYSYLHSPNTKIPIKQFHCHQTITVILILDSEFYLKTEQNWCMIKESGQCLLISGLTRKKVNGSSNLTFQCFCSCLILPLICLTL